jgi:hypothetical protein
LDFWYENKPSGNRTQTYTCYFEPDERNLLVAKTIFCRLKWIPRSLVDATPWTEPILSEFDAVIKIFDIFFLFTKKVTTS